jgi:hypothetical protein
LYAIYLFALCGLFAAICLFAFLHHITTKDDIADRRVTWSVQMPAKSKRKQCLLQFKKKQKTSPFLRGLE